MNNVITKSLRYIKNTNGGAKLHNFIEDHDPIGMLLWTDLHNQNVKLVREDEDGRLWLTTEGEEALK